MITRINTTQELKQMFLEILLNKTDKINDISAESVLNGIAFGCAKLAQKCLVNQSVVEGHIFPDTSYGVYLDNLAAVRGVAPRFGACGSSTYIRLIADPNTYYDSASVTFTSTNGITFVMEENVLIGINGYAYTKVHSQSVGAITNVDPLTINTINNQPNGHISVTNEYRAMGGRDMEPDNLFRQRIKDSINALSRTTISYLEQVFMTINPNVLRVFKGGIDSFGRINLYVLGVNGANFTQEEFDNIISRSNEYLSLIELLNAVGEDTLVLNNIDWLPVDIEFRVDIDPAYDESAVRKQIQIQMCKLFDYRYWNYGDKVEWENLLYAAKSVDGVRYVPDIHFSPRADINVPKYRLPRVRGFIMRDLDGNIIEDNNGVMSDIYYPNEIDYPYQASVLSNI